MDLKKVHSILIKRYLEMLEKNNIHNNIYDMLQTLKKNINIFPDDKTSRWIGYIQYFIIDNGFSTVNTERNFSRPYFHKAYKNMNIDIPETITV